ncbi:MAG TPA: hypothetical protein VE591_09090 [Candidatus Acidoferrum sp.]|nr:hypothetical protein [Candidatus Acidoferrum sp.]
MRRAVLAPFAALVVLFTATPSAAQGLNTVTIVCEYTPFWVFNGNDNLPRKAAEPYPLLGQRFRILNGLRTTLAGRQYYETEVVVVEPAYNTPGYGGRRAIAHYWVSADCAIPDRFIPR